MKNQADDAAQQPSNQDGANPRESHELSALMERLVMENRGQMADFAKAMQLRDDFAVRIGRRTTQIIRFSLVGLTVLAFLMMALILTLISNMRDITTRMNEITQNIANMNGTFNQVAVDMRNMDASVARINDHLDVLNGQMDHMGRDVNTLSSPMRMMPFRP